MSAPPPMPRWNQDLRLAIELMAFGGIWAGTFATSTSWSRWLLSVLGPLIAAGAWNLLNVPDDPSRTEPPKIRIPGWFRILIEAAVLGAGLWGWLGDWYINVLPLYVAAIVVHYAASFRRLQWLAGG